MTRNGQRLMMLIDDEPAQRRLVAAIAARRGWRTVFAGDPETAIAMLGTQDGMALDAIILDSASSDADSETLILELRERRPQLPILVLTANSSVAAAVGAMRAGASDFLVKPIASERLLAALEAAVGGKAARIGRVVAKLLDAIGIRIDTQQTIRLGRDPQAPLPVELHAADLVAGQRMRSACPRVIPRQRLAGFRKPVNA